MSQFEAFLLEREQSSQGNFTENDEISFYHSSQLLNEKCHDYDPEKEIPVVQLKVDQEKRILRATRHEFSDSSPGTSDQAKDEANFPRPVEAIDLGMIYANNFKHRRLQTVALYGSLWFRSYDYNDNHRYLFVDGTGCVEVIYRIQKDRIKDAETKKEQLKTKKFPKTTLDALKKANELILDHLTEPIQSGTVVTVMGTNLVRHPRGHLILKASRIIQDPSGYQQNAFKALLLQSKTAS